MQIPWKKVVLLLALMYSVAKSSDEIDRDEILSFFDCEGELSCYFLERNLRRDTKNCHIDPQLIFHSRDRQVSEYELAGRMRYLGFFPKKYRYNMIRGDQGRLVVQVFISIYNFEDFTIFEQARLKRKLEKAAEFWNQSVYGHGIGPLQFDFQITDKSIAHYNVKLVHDSTRGPYSYKWSLLWNYKTLAHELGHMMGLDDEYKNYPWGSDTSTCSPDSLMCFSQVGKPQRYHYYLILRREYCEDAQELIYNRLISSSR